MRCTAKAAAATRGCAKCGGASKRVEFQRAALFIGAMSDYSYPVSEDITEPAEAAQDPGKRTREQRLLAEHANFGWTRALDFGCGRGGNLAVLAGTGSGANKTILGVDIDAKRVEQAREAAKVVSGAGIETRVADIEAIEAWPKNEMFDLILVCQIIGHTPTALTGRILESLRARLSPGGKMIVCYPFVTPSAAETLDAPRDDDYYHLVDFGALPDVQAFRRRLTRAAFDAASKTPSPGLLPVRAFMAGDMAWKAGEPLPAEGNTPPAVAMHLRGLSLQSMLYSVHYVAPDTGRAGIGDMATVAID